MYTPMVDDINVTINSLYQYVPSLIPPVETQLMFNEGNQNNYKFSFDENYTERRVISEMIGQKDIGSPQQINSPKYLIGALQTRDRADTPNNKINIAIFDNLNLRKY